MESRIQSRSLFEVAGRVLAKCQGARRDERNGFPFSAAMEWREAAGLCASISFLADFCWREWERIMGLPRQMAGCPIVLRKLAFGFSASSPARVNVNPCH